MVIRGLIMLLGIAILSGVVWGLEQLQATLVVDALAVFGLYAGIFAASNWVFMREYRQEIRQIREDK